MRIEEEKSGQVRFTLAPPQASSTSTMARGMQCSDAGYVYHVRNRAVGRLTLFDKPADYAAFAAVREKAST